MSRIAIVTGVSKGLGASLARVLVARGCDVVGIGRSADPPLARPRFRLLACDLSDAGAVARVANEMPAQAARASWTHAVLINNAAVAGPIGRLGDLDATAIAAAVTANLAAPAMLADAFVRAFARGERRVINVSSGAAAMSLPGSAVYCATKAGLESLTRTLAAEARDASLFAIGIRPGIVDTPMQAFMRSQPPGRLPDVAKFVQFHESGQLASPDAVAATIVDRLVLGSVENGRVYSIAELAAK